MAHYDLHTKDLKAMAPKLRAGDTVTLTGTLYTARDAAHKRIVTAMQEGTPQPSIMQARPRPSPARSSVRSVRPPRAAWTPMHRHCSMPGCAA